MSIEIPSGQQQRGCSLWWVVALALLVVGVGLLLAQRPWEEEAVVVVRAAPLPTPVPGWESYRGAPAAAGTLTAAGRETPTAVPQAAIAVVVPQVVIEPVVTVPQVTTQPVVLPPIESPTWHNECNNEWDSEYHNEWDSEYHNECNEDADWDQAWMAGPGGPVPGDMGRPWQAGPQMGIWRNPMPGPGCGPQPGRPGQPWAYTR